MEFAIIVSKKDPAGLNIKDCLLEELQFQKKGIFNGSDFYETRFPGKKILLYTIDKYTIFYEEAGKDIETDFFIFATRHKSKSGEKTLSIHFPGNFGKAEYGGRDRELCIAPSNLLKTAFISLDKIAKNSGYSVTMEATHHGPLIDKPAMFIEIGSLEKEWADRSAGRMIARTILRAIRDYPSEEYETAIGVGGTHYCSNFNRLELNSDVAFSHVCPKHNVHLLDREMLVKLAKSSYENISYFLIDWKGVSGEDKKRLIPLLEELKIRWKKTSDITSQNLSD